MPKLDFKSPGFVGVVGAEDLPSGPIQISILGGVGTGATIFNQNQVGLNDFSNSYYSESNGGLIPGLSVTRIKVGFAGTGAHKFSVINSSTGVVLANVFPAAATAFYSLDTPILITSGMSLNIAVIGQSAVRARTFVNAGGGTRVERDISNGPWATISSPVIGDFLLCTGCSIGWEIEMELV